MKKNLPKTTHFLLVNCLDKDHIIQYRDIICLQASNSQTSIYTHSGSKHEPVVVVAKPLRELELLLPSVKFFRSHRSWIIHLEYVIEHLKGDNHFIKMFEGKEIPLSREREDVFIPALELYNSTI